MCWRRTFYRSQDQQRRRMPLPRTSVNSITGLDTWITCWNSIARLYRKPGKVITMAPASWKKKAVYRSGHYLYSWAENITIWILFAVILCAAPFCSFPLLTTPPQMLIFDCCLLNTSGYLPTPWFFVNRQDSCRRYTEEVNTWQVVDGIQMELPTQAYLYV